jgi:hypothetical protein
MSRDLDSGVAVGCLIFIVWGFLAWFTHVVVCIKTASWLFLIAGAIMFPVAVIHGTGIWFGIW